MKIPLFLRKFIWTFYPPRYHEIAEQKKRTTLAYMAKILMIAFIIGGLFYLPALFSMKGVIQDELGKISQFTISGNVSQSAPITVPPEKPFVLMDLNNDHNITQEIFVIDKNEIKYRWFGIRGAKLDDLKDITAHRAEVSGFLTAFIMLTLPSIAILFYVRALVKYILMGIVLGSLFFIIFELTKFRVRWKHAVNISWHAATPIIFVEAISAPIATAYLIPVSRFIGVNIYAATTIAWAVLIIMGIIGAQVKDRLLKRK